MSNVAPRSQEELETLAPVFAGAKAVMGFVPNSMLTMAHMPQLPVAFSLLTNVVFGGDLKAIMNRLGTVVPEPGEVAPPQDVVPYEERPLYDERGKLNNTIIPAQDEAAWVMQGAITDRTTEHLGVTDVGIIMFRKLLEEQIKIVEDGGEPINVHRDPAKNDAMSLATEHTFYPGYTHTGGPFADKPLLPPEVGATLKT